jgi:PLAT/LH2 domain
MPDYPPISRSGRLRRAWVRWLAAALCAFCLVGGALAIPATSAGALPKCPANPSTADRETEDPACLPGPRDDGHGGKNQPPDGGRITATDRTQSSFTVSWLIPSSATSFRVERVVGGTATTLYEHLSDGADSTLTEKRLLADTQYCYRLYTFNSYGTGPITSDCQYTKDGKQSLIYRTQIQITTGSTDGAGTDDVVHVTLGGYGGGDAAGGTTQLDSPRDDFEPGSTATYDLVNTGSIGELGDIHSLYIYKPGDDDWCIASATLIIDGVPVATAAFGPPCTTVTKNDTVSISNEQMRADPQWTSFKAPLTSMAQPDGTTLIPLQFTRAAIQQQIEAMVGDQVQGTALKWGDKDAAQVVVTPNSPTADSVHMHMALDSPLDDPGVDIDFKLNVSTEFDSTTKEWNLVLTRADVTTNVDFSILDNVLNIVVAPLCGPIASVVEWQPIPLCLQYIGDRVESTLDDQFNADPTKTGTSPLLSNLTASFDADGNLNLGLILGTPKANLGTWAGPGTDAGNWAGTPVETAPPVDAPPVVEAPPVVDTPPPPPVVYEPPPVTHTPGPNGRTLLDP